ncbi:TetR family transcriptional regulator [Nocardioides sp. TF02-7]|uniref:TetR family transcriptional regulator n=1 Tax=Nocardioides sp. TF02-7 TaxID=2917724 RepID=UPI001F05F9AF|nr:TetR family transcriptional regulator [Nocardioides sp. TF02-7]UMG92323.1 TetR family transcriptional regulator [Nocardioides sp. TF02-7]
MTTPQSLTTDEPGSAAQRDRRKRILDATYQLAKEGGFDAVQMRAVAEQADVALGTLYRYFPSKIHLLVSALARQLGEAQQRLQSREIPGDTSADRVLYVLKRLTRGMQGDPPADGGAHPRVHVRRQHRRRRDPHRRDVDDVDRHPRHARHSG